MSTPTLGIVVLGLGHNTLAGMVGDARSHPEGTLVEHVFAEGLLRRATVADQELLAEVTAAASRLVDRGADLVGTSCGYFAPFQRSLAEALPVPVFTTPLMQLPSLLASLPRDRRVLVVAAVAHGVDARCLEACGVPTDEVDRIAVVGMDRPGHFADAVLAHRIDPDPGAFVAQIVEVIAQAIDGSGGDIGAIVLECGEMPAAGQAVRESFPLPVIDYLSYFAGAVAMR